MGEESPRDPQKHLREEEPEDTDSTSKGTSHVGLPGHLPHSLSSPFLGESKALDLKLGKEVLIQERETEKKLATPFFL